jgi:hypothetical protein
MNDTVRFESVEIGTELPPLDIPITTTLIIAGALASRDYTPVHHDKTPRKRRECPTCS